MKPSIVQKAAPVYRFLAQYMGQVNEWTAWMLFASLPFYYSHYTQATLIAFFTTWALDILLNQRWREIRWSCPEQRWMMAIWGALVAYYLLDLLYYPLETNREFWHVIVGQQRLSYWGFAIVGIVGIRRHYRVKPFLIIGLAMVYLTLLTVLFVFEGWAVFLDPSGGWTHYMYERHTHISPHMVYNLYCNTVLLLLFFQLRQEKGHWRKVLWLLAGLPIYLVVCISDGRVGVIGAQIVILAGLCRLLQVKKRYFFGAILVLAALGASLIATHPKFNWETMRSSDTNPRLVIWQIGAEGVRQQPLYGRGSSSAAVYMREQMLAHEQAFEHDPHIVHALKEEGNVCAHPHNAWLQALLEHGIGGLLLMAIVLIAPFFVALRARAPMLASAFWLCVNLQLLTEPIHSAFSEVTFCAYLLLFLHFCRR